MKRLIVLVGFLFMLHKAKAQTGLSTFYANKFVGRRTATGEIYSHSKLTAASNHFKLGTLVKVTNLKNLKSVVVKINDRMSTWASRKGRIIDLSRLAARMIQADQLTQVNIQIKPE